MPKRCALSRSTSISIVGSVGGLSTCGSTTPSTSAITSLDPLGLLSQDLGVLPEDPNHDRLVGSGEDVETRVPVTWLSPSLSAPTLRIFWAV